MKNITNYIFIVTTLIVSGCSSLPSDYEAASTHYYTDTGNSALGKKSSELLGGDTDKSVMYLVNEGTDAFFARMALLAYVSAQRKCVHESLTQVFGRPPGKPDGDPVLGQLGGPPYRP